MSLQEIFWTHVLLEVAIIVCMFGLFITCFILYVFRDKSKPFLKEILTDICMMFDRAFYGIMDRIVGVAHEVISKRRAKALLKR